ncbi:lysylphosphatidylglycerol synthase transmembrane domain-containing protein [Maribacter sp. 2304DJ31-5]|uniref:lysylphosphatidylglycerol synthase transmembrane domain-containing protein n=1 Tax=Maribacter sp. 2304DJ31-5 TaxID=3386273 RepID=UPI0039BC9A9E
MTNLRKTGTTLFKVLLSAILIYFIVIKIDIDEIGEILKKSNLFYIFTGAVFFLLSKIIAAFRLNLYFHQLRVFLTEKSNLKLYFLGMFYNLFLPGGIGGDAYKGYLIKKQFNIPTKKVVSVLLLDRLSGLLLLFLYACSLLILLDHETINAYKILFSLAIPSSALIFWLFNRQFFNYTLPVFWKSLAYSAGVQLAQLCCVYLIILGLGIGTDHIAYLVIFLVSSIVSVIPLTLGGIGSREVTFFYGASLLGLNENLSIGISVIFFLITALLSFIGIVYHVKKINLAVIQKS